MTKEQLIAAGLTDDLAEKVLAMFKTSIDGSYIPKERFNTVNAEAKQLKDSLKERDAQLETLKNAAGAVDALKKQIADLQAANQEKEKEHTAALKKIRREALDERLLIESKAINATAVKPFLTAIDDGVDDEGYIVLRRQHIEAIAKSDSTKFLFRAEGEGQKFTGVKPGESGDGTGAAGSSGATAAGGVNPFDPKTYDEKAQIALFRSNPDSARAMAKQAGIPIL